MRGEQPTENSSQGVAGVLDRTLALLREPALVLDKDLCVVHLNTAARSALGVNGDVTQMRCMDALGTRGYGHTIQRVARLALESRQETSARLSVAKPGWESLRWTVRALCVSGDSDSEGEEVHVMVALTLEGPSGGRWVKGFVKEEGDGGREPSRILLDLLPDIVFEVDAEGRLLYANGMALELLGYEPETLEKLNLSDLLSPKDKMDLQEVLQQMIGGELVHRNMHYDLQRRDGRRIPVEVNAIVIQGPDSKPRVLGIARDHTQRLRLEERLRQSEERYRGLFESSRDLIFSMDREGIVLEINRAGVALSGQPRHCIIGKRFGSLLVPDSVISFQRSVSQTLEGRSVDVEVEIVGNRNQRHLLEVALAPIHQEGEVLQIHGTARDVTEKHRLQEQVDQFQRMESLGRLAAGVAHDFNNVLGAVLGLASVLDMDLPCDHKCREDLSSIVQAARQGSELTRQILSFARGGARKNENIDMQAVVNEVAQLLRRTLPSCVSLEVDSVGNLPPVEGDAGQIQQVVMNLCVNARDAMQGSGAIHVHLRNRKRWPEDLHVEPQEETLVELSVSDDGPGIPEEIRAHIFEPFFTTKSGDKGLGLGLSVCWGIIRDHGGHIDAPLRSGSGATFRVLLPASSMEEAMAPCDSSSPEEAESGGLALVVDDQEPMLRAARRMLELAGYQVVCATCWGNLEGILDSFEAAPDITVLDLGLPDTDGLTVYREMKKRFADPAVIAVSGYSYEGAARQILKEGAKEFIQKPFSWTQLKEALGRVTR